MGYKAFENLKPETMNAVTWETVLEAWENGLSDREAAFRASKISGVPITAEEIRQMCKDNPEIGELRANLMSELLVTAKLNIASDLRDPKSKERMKTSRWYAERKSDGEFSTKQSVAFEGAVVGLSLEEKENALKELMENFHNGGQ